MCSKRSHLNKQERKMASKELNREGKKKKREKNKKAHQQLNVKIFPVNLQSGRPE